MNVGGSHSNEELETMAKRFHPRLRKRFDAVILAKQGLSARRIAETLGCSYRAVQIWVDNYNQRGVEGLTAWWASRGSKSAAATAPCEA